MSTPGAIAHFANHRWDPELPSSWGPPPPEARGGKHSPGRAAWIRRMVELHTVTGRAAVIARWQGRGEAITPAAVLARLQEVERRGRELDRLVELREKVARLRNP